MPKKYDSKQTIELILTTAAGLFLKKGFDKTSMQDIAAAAGISKGAIYHHFTSKEEIRNRVKDRQSHTLFAEADQWLKQWSGHTGKEKLIAVLKQSMIPQGRDLDQSISHCAKSPEFVVQYMQNCVTQSAPFLAKLMRQGMEDGSIETRFPEECAEVFALLLNVWCDPAIFPCSREKLRNRLQFLQYAASAVGLDVLSSEMIDGLLDFLQQFYPEEMTRPDSTEK